MYFSNVLDIKSVCKNFIIFSALIHWYHAYYDSLVAASSPKTKRKTPVRADMSNFVTI